MKGSRNLLLCLVLAFSCGGCVWSDVHRASGDADSEFEPEAIAKSPKLEVSFWFNRQSQKSSNQFAIWIENTHGSHVKTLFTTRWTAQGGWKIWDVLLPDWKKAAQPKTMTPATIDSISGATPSTGVFSRAWDCKDEKGNLVPAGEYRYVIEANLQWENRVLYTGTFFMGGTDQKPEVECKYISDYIDARTMITEVMVHYFP